MTVSWPHTDEYADLYESAEWQREDPLRAAQGIFNGLLISGAIWLMALCAWAWVKFGRYFA